MEKRVTPTILDILSIQEPGAGGEIQLTDALDVLNQKQHIFACEVKGKRYDVGEVPGFVKANIDFALRDPSMQDEIWQYLYQLTKDKVISNEQHA